VKGNDLGLPQKVLEVAAQTHEDSQYHRFRAEISTSFGGATVQM
jgi:hypothetical protein